MVTTLRWSGTHQDSLDLANAIARNCSCEFGLMGVRLTTCVPHRMLTDDQRVLDGLLFGRWLANRLRQEEHAIQDNDARPDNVVSVDWSGSLDRAA